MVDARLPGAWLTELRFMDFTDRQWRIFTNALMWSAEQGTDGRIPTRYLRMLHSDGIEDADVDALVAAGVFSRTDDGVEMPGWSEERGLRQSTAAAVEQYRARKRENQAAYRQRLRESLEAGHVTGHVGGNVGLGLSDDSSVEALAYVDGNVTGNDPPSRYCPEHPRGTDVPCVPCMNARKAAEAWKPPKRPPRYDCESGKHKWLRDGTCNFCAERRIPTNDEWMYR